MKVVSRSTGETLAEIVTNHSMTVEEALTLAGYERNNRDDDYPDYSHPDGTDAWVEDCEMIYD